MDFPAPDHPMLSFLFGITGVVGGHGYGTDLMPNLNRRFYRIVGF